MWLDPELPYLTPDFEPLGGKIKQELDDFVVEERGLFSPSGEGEHLYVSITKTDITTFGVINRLSNILKIPEKGIGYAGLKDRSAIATQVFSIQHCKETDLEKCDIPGIRINWMKPHNHKLRAGQLRGNSFKIILRDLSGKGGDSESFLTELFQQIAQKGFPNYYGSQRFGYRRDSHLVGGALLRGKHKEAVGYILGKPRSPEEEDESREARCAYEAGDYEKAYICFTRRFSLERRLLYYILRAGPNYFGAVKRIPKTTKRLLVSAFQSHLFNFVLADRIRFDALAELWKGDAAMKHDNGAVFIVEDQEVEEERFRRFEISPTGPMFGKKMLQPEGRAQQFEEKALASEDLRHEDFHKVSPGLKLRGARRSLRIQPQEINWELRGRDLHLSFYLPKGCYATTFLREVAKPEMIQSS